jgi:hypothetical protein
MAFFYSVLAFLVLVVSLFVHNNLSMVFTDIINIVMDQNTHAIESVFYIVIKVLIFVFVICVLFSIPLCLRDEHKDENKRKPALSDANLETYLEIQSWLDDPTVRAYRDGVVAEGRGFIGAEVKAMRDYYEGRADQEAQEKKNAKINNACRMVYGIEEVKVI